MLSIFSCFQIRVFFFGQEVGVPMPASTLTNWVTFRLFNLSARLFTQRNNRIKQTGNYTRPTCGWAEERQSVKSMSHPFPHTVGASHGKCGVSHRA